MERNAVHAPEERRIPRKPVVAPLKAEPHLHIHRALRWRDLLELEDANANLDRRVGRRDELEQVEVAIVLWECATGSEIATEEPSAHRDLVCLLRPLQPDARLDDGQHESRRRELCAAIIRACFHTFGDGEVTVCGVNSFIPTSTPRA